MPDDTGGICPEIYIFGRFILQYLQYFLMLYSQTYPCWSSWGLLRTSLVHAVLVVPYPCHCPPFCPICCIGLLPFLGQYFQGTIQVPNTLSASMQRFQPWFLCSAPAWCVSGIPCPFISPFLSSWCSSSLSRGITTAITGQYYPCVLLAFW